MRVSNSSIQSASMDADQDPSGRAAIAEHCNVVGLDLVEVHPTLDVGTGITSYLAAHTVLAFLGNICLQPRWERHREARAAARG